MDGVTAASDLPAQYEVAYQHLLQRVYRALGCTNLDDVSTIRDEVASFIDSVTEDRYILPLSDYDAMIRNGDSMLESLDERLDLIRAQPQDAPTNGSAHPPFSDDDLSFIDHYGDVYDHLHERVTIGLVSHASDITALAALRGDVSAFLANLEQHSLRVPGPDYAAMRTNAVQMLAALDDAQADVRVPSASAYIRIVNSIPEAYDVLLARVNRTLLAHLGNGPEIAATRADAISIHTQVQFHRHALPADGYASLSYNITQMIEALDDAAEQCRDPPDAPPISVTHNPTNRIGRPRLDIDVDFLREALKYTSVTEIASFLGCHPRTVRRRALEYGLAVPGDPVCTYTVDEDGICRKRYTPNRVPTYITQITDEELDVLIDNYLTDFPYLGRRMLDGCLRADGYRIPASRIIASYRRVHGAPAAFSNRRIGRTKYSVAGANSLWHHDGQHGLIRYKIIIHAFVDGKSRFVTGIRASNNNRKDTVLDLFLAAVDVHGVPSRVRGDFGTENLAVAEWMEVHRGKGRGSYIWGRSVHNTRIERLWYDVTRGFGRKWKDFFHVLEEEAGLDPHDRGHIWLLHHLFLDAINADALAWAHAWNSHKLRQDDSPPRSPCHMFFFSQMRDGRRGITIAPTPVEEEVADPANYGIDPDTLRNPRLMAHFRDNNPDDSEDPAVVPSFPPRLSHVECQPPNCPLPPEHVELMDSAVRQRAPVRSNSLIARRHVWLEALNIYNHLVSVLST